ncbi:hypothetical protein JQ036_09575 [Clostridium botulinum]|nr:hypothetical protein [Clostridium botulinum]
MANGAALKASANPSPLARTAYSDVSHPPLHIEAEVSYRSLPSNLLKLISSLAFTLLELTIKIKVMANKIKNILFFL